MDSTDAPKPLADLLEPGATLMVGTRRPTGDWDFRPLTVARVGGSRIDILLDTNERWVREFSDGDGIHATSSDNRANTWLHLRGDGHVSFDDRLIDELWNPFASAYFEHGRETPGIGVLSIDATDGRYWSTPSGRIGSLVSMVRAAVGHPDRSGDHGDVAL